MADFLWISLIASIILTVAVNLVFWFFPAGKGSLSEWINQQVSDQIDNPRSGVRVIFPWKTVIVVSVLLTIVLNLGLLRAF